MFNNVLTLYGSQEFNDENLLKEELEKSNFDFCLIGGSSKESFIETFLKKNKVNHSILYPKTKEIKSVYERNSSLVDLSKEITVFHNLESRGAFIFLQQACFAKKSPKVKYFCFPSTVLNKDIKGFLNEDFWLSNLFPCNIEGAGRLEGKIYPNVSFAMKEARDSCSMEEWSKIRERVFYTFSRRKFQNPYLRKKLLLTTGRIYSVVNNDDLFWGCNSELVGENRFGKIIESIRKELTEEEDKKEQYINFFC